MKTRPTIIDFVEHYTQKFSEHVFLREKINDVWTETTFRETREMAHRLGAGFMALGLEKGERVAFLSQGRSNGNSGTIPPSYQLRVTAGRPIFFMLSRAGKRYVIFSADGQESVISIVELPITASG